ncbi:hypothetical protein PUN28_014503 [Cardiocondyla obscurior]|uniref:Uncharacterized protein n=1 Tax=Cardiocondyla obscurior TaxID=286306 RepID=A0AAW2F0F6_9HYME
MITIAPRKCSTHILRAATKCLNWLEGNNATYSSETLSRIYFETYRVSRLRRADVIFYFTSLLRRLLLLRWLRLDNAVIRYRSIVINICAHFFFVQKLIKRRL